MINYHHELIATLAKMLEDKDSRELDSLEELNDSWSQEVESRKAYRNIIVAVRGAIEIIEEQDSEIRQLERELEC